jgi:hypothetical protein
MTRNQAFSAVLGLVLAGAALGCTNGTSYTGPEPGGGDVGTFVTAQKQWAAYPTRIAVAADTTFVSDAIGNQVIGHGADGAATVALQGVARPLGVAVAGDLLYVGSAGRGSVEVYSLGQKRFLRYLGAAGSFAMPNSIAAAPDGVVYVVDSKRDLVRVFAADGREQSSIGTSGSGEGQLKFPIAVAADATRVVVGDQGNARVQVFNRQGAFVRAFGQALTGAILARQQFAGRFSMVQSVALQGDEIHVLDSYHSHVMVFDGVGTCKGSYGAQKDFVLGLDLALPREGVALVADPERRRIAEITTNLGWTL